MKINGNSAFTLVELLVVIVILAILSTVGFVSYVGYAADARDTTRLADTGNIYRAILSTSIANGKALLPEDYIEIKLNGNIIGYQGEVGKSTLGEIAMDNGGVDPKDGDLYSYFLSGDKKQIQILAYFEEAENLPLAFSNQTAYATEYQERTPFFQGTGLGLLLDENDQPIHRRTDIIDVGELDMFGSGATIGGGQPYQFKVQPVYSNSKRMLAPAVFAGGQMELLSRRPTSLTSADCPEHYIPVPGNPEIGQPDFCIGKYEAAEDYVTEPGLTPKNGLGFTDKMCNNLGDSYHVMTINEWLTIARNIEKQPSNWSGGSVGNGYIKTGNSGNTSTGINPDPGTYLQTNDSGNSLRELTLSNGEKIWDFIGNYWELVKGYNIYNPDILFDINNPSTKYNTEFQYINDEFSHTDLSITIGGGGSFISWNNVIDTYFMNYFGPETTYNESLGIGMIRKTSGSSQIHYVVGGDRTDGGNENGLFSMINADDVGTPNISTRCAYIPR
ncbi:MAG: type II secretion system protein [Candidatus Gracilibacteria bacterium]|nr:type II secretion system protein [Candidatus Gracilibacteria bacterium]